MVEQRKYPVGQHPDLPAPLGERGIFRWLKNNLFGSALNTALTLVGFYITYTIMSSFLEWAVFEATVNANHRNECYQLGSGACWAVIVDRFDQLIYGFYPVDFRWRINLSFVLLLIALTPLLFEIPYRKYFLIFSFFYPFIAFALIWGIEFIPGLDSVSSSEFGGFMLTMLIGVIAIACSLPIGIMLALGRTGKLKMIQWISVGFIEFIRGVPLITLLFVASTLLNYFLPPGNRLDLLLRVFVMVSLFAAGYLAEVVRGGLAAVPRGQYEAADMLGMTYWQSMRVIILPQALKISIPGIVNTFIALFKDTTLVVIIGLLDPLGVAQATLADSTWQGLSNEIYIFIAVGFFISCFSMSRYSLYLEKKLHTGH